LPSTIRLGRTAAVVFALAISGCSPYVYQTEISTFGKGVDSFVSSYAAGKQALADDATADREAAWVASRVRLQYLPGCVVLNPVGNPPALPDCGVVRVGNSALPSPSPAQVLAADPKAAAVFSALSDYSTALQAITNATDNSNLAAATQSLDTAAGKAASAVTTAAPAAKVNANTAAASVGVLTEGITLYLNERRLAVLRKYVIPMQETVAILASVGAKTLDTINNDRETRLIHLIGADDRPLLAGTQRLSAAAYQADEHKLNSDVAALNALRTTNPIATGQALISAHAKLVAALQDNSGQIQPILTAISAFVTQAGQLQSAIAAGSAKKATSS
jgi:hypothetical protein